VVTALVAFAGLLTALGFGLAMLPYASLEALRRLGL
jgi:hypothetical protein